MSMTKFSEHPGLESAAREFAATGHNAILGLTFSGTGPGWVEFRLDWRAELVADAASGALDPGVIYSLLDSACALTSWAKLGYFSPYPTLDFRLDYIRPTTAGAGLIGRGECYAISADYAFTRGIAHEGDPGDPVAHCTGTFMSYQERKK